MNRLSTSQQNAIRQIVSLTGVNQNSAIAMLRRYQWSIERTANAIYDGEFPTDNSASEAVVRKIFAQYKDPDGKEIGIDGTIQFVQDLDLALEDPIVLAICCECEAPSQGVFTEDGFVKGWSSHNVRSLDDMKKVVNDLRDKMEKDPKYFTKVYRYTFVFNLSDGLRILPLDTAVPLWSLLLQGRYRYLDQWLEFIQNEYKKSISKDTWNMLWDFANYHQTDPKLERYDEEASWPTVIDEFVEYLKPQL